jgi:uncharacterized protein (DUF1697 family)
MSGTRVIFMRGVNVGGNKTFRPSELVRQLAPLQLVSIGAAGTFVVGAGATEAQLRSAFAKALAFEAELMICTGREVLDLIANDPFAGSPAAEGQYITVLAKRPKRASPIPHDVPADEWQIRLTEVRGPFVASVRRAVGTPRYYPNEVVEKLFGVPATTRGWPTILRIGKALEVESKSSPSSARKRTSKTRG